MDAPEQSACSGTPAGTGPVDLSGQGLSDGPCSRAGCAGICTGDPGRSGGGGLCDGAPRRSGHRAANRDAALASGGIPRGASHPARRVAHRSDRRLGPAGSGSRLSGRGVHFRCPAGRRGYASAATGTRHPRHARRRLSRSVALSAPRLCRVLPVAARASDPCAGPCGRAWYAGMVAGQVGGAVRCLLARGAGGRDAGDLSVHC